MSTSHTEAHQAEGWVEGDGVCYHPDCVTARGQHLLDEARVRQAKKSDEATARYAANGGNLD